jgi:predicted enzyme related to lactoylglutathione lyase
MHVEAMCQESAIGSLSADDTEWAMTFYCEVFGCQFIGWECEAPQGREHGRRFYIGGNTRPACRGQWNTAKTQPPGGTAFIVHRLRVETLTRPADNPTDPDDKLESVSYS